MPKDFLSINPEKQHQHSKREYIEKNPLTIHPDKYPENYWIEQEEKEKRNISRRNFLIASTITLGTVLTQDENSIDRIEKFSNIEGEKNFEFYKELLVKELDASYDFFRNLDISKLAEIRFNNYLQQNKNSPLKKDYFEKRTKEQTTEATEHYNQATKLIQELTPYSVFRQFLPKLVEYIQQLKKFKNAKNLDDQFYEYLVEIELFINPLKNFKYAEKIEKEYNIKIEGHSKYILRAGIENIYNDLRRLPVFVVKRSNVKIIHLYDLWGTIAGRASSSGLQIDAYESRKPNNISTHEISHYLDYKDEGLFSIDDDSAWAKTNKEAMPYTYPTGMMAIVVNNMIGSSKEGNIPKFAKVYGKEGGVLEDKATISEALFHTTTLQELVSRTEHDEVLRQKLELMTGYRLEYRDILQKEGDNEVKTRKLFFGSALSDSYYKDHGFLDRNYWSVWSKDEKGKVWMDAEYYNFILDGYDITFREDEQGRTVRQRTKEGK